MKRRYIVEAIGIAALFVMVIISGQVVRGYLATRTYVPDIVNEYSTTDYLQHEVAIGIAIHMDGWDYFAIIIGLFIWIVGYHQVRVWLKRRSGKRR